MKKKKAPQPSRRETTVLRQLVELIPPCLVPKLARECGLTAQARTFSPWSHVVAMIYAQVSHACGLNDVCDALCSHVAALFGRRAATLPARNTISHANKERDSAFAGKLFWKMFAHLQAGHPGFSRDGKKSIAGVSAAHPRCRRHPHSARGQLPRVGEAPPAQSRREVHLGLDLRSFLPRFAIVDTAGENGSVRAPELCADLREREIAIFDKAYVHFAQLGALATRSVFWVTRAKANLKLKVKKRLPKHADPRILRDDLVVLQGGQGGVHGFVLSLPI